MMIRSLIRRNCLITTLLLLVAMTAVACSDTVPGSPSVQEAKEYSDLTMTFDEELQDNSEPAEEPSSDPKDNMSEDEYLKFLSGTIPYVGMYEEYIDKTACGRHTDTYEDYSQTYYYWKHDDLNALTVIVEEGQTVSVLPINEDVFWDDDMPHLEEKDGEKVWTAIPGALHKRWEAHEDWRDNDVDRFATAEEYADYYLDDYAELLYYELKDEDDGIDSDDPLINELAYEDAMNHWENNQPWPEPRE